jgi:hypothetical protein
MSKFQAVPARRKVEQPRKRRPERKQDNRRR